MCLTHVRGALCNIRCDINVGHIGKLLLKRFQLPLLFTHDNVLSIIFKVNKVIIQIDDAGTIHKF